MKISLMASFLLGAVPEGRWEKIEKFPDYGVFIESALSAGVTYERDADPKGQIVHYPASLDAAWSLMSGVKQIILFTDPSKKTPCSQAQKSWSALKHAAGSKGSDSPDRLYFSLGLIVPSHYDDRGNCLGKKEDFPQHFSKRR